jgi:hypothetical protein
MSATSEQHGSAWERALNMVMGMSLSTFTLVHVVLSLIGIVTGFVVIFAMFSAKRMNGMTAVFILTTALTSVSGFGFPFDHLLPSHKLGIVSLVALLVAIVARYALHLLGEARWIYAVTAVIAQYLNVFVLVVQGFLKVPALHTMAPTGTEAPFFIAQGIVLLVFIVLGTYAVKRFHPGAVRAA